MALVEDSLAVGENRPRLIKVSEYADPRTEKMRPPFVTARFALNDGSRAEVRRMPYRFGFDGFGEATFYRTYSRTMANGCQESWPDTVLRVVDGVFSIRKDWYTKQRLPWDEGYWQERADEMARAMLSMEFLPPGRGLFAMGTEYVYQRGSMALFNCGSTSITDLAADMGWVMDALMCGVGIGIETLPTRVELRAPSGPRALYAVPDSREGWVESEELLLRSYLEGSNPIDFDYSPIRDEGTPLKGIGGYAAGPDPLRKLHEHTRETCERYLRGEFGATRLKADIGNGIGCCVVMGNVRRSAEILLGQLSDSEFLDLKNYDLHPERRAYGWMSNNSVCLLSHRDFEMMPEIAARIRKNGEPGFINRVAISKFGRFGREMPDAATLMNPCVPGDTRILTRMGYREIAGLVGQDVEVWNGEEWSHVRPSVTGHDQQLVRVTLSDGSALTCTRAHRWLLDGADGPMPVAAEELEPGDVLVKTRFPVVGDVDPSEPGPSRAYTHGFYCGDGFFDTSRARKAAWLYGDKNALAEHLVITNNPRAESACGSRTYVRFPAEIPEKFAVPFDASARERLDWFAGLLDADGTVMRNPNSLALCIESVEPEFLASVRLMLTTLGVSAKVVRGRVAGARVMPDGGGGEKEYACRETRRLLVNAADTYALVRLGLRTHRLALTEMRPQRDARRFVEVVDVEYAGTAETVYCFSEPLRHAGCFEGIVTGQCGEIPLESKEVCNLSEVFPTRCADDASLFRAMRLATLYSSTVALLPTHRPETNRVMARNRRIGVSVSGVAEWLDEIGMARMTRLLRDGYKVIRAENTRLATEAGVPPSIRVTTIKPSGSISQLVGVSSGMHFPTFKYALRRMRCGRQLPVVECLRAAGYHVQPDPDEPEKTLVFDFPIDQGKARKATDVSVWEQALVLTTLQREWADNSVSCTLFFNPKTEGDVLEHVLASIAPMVKSVSALPHYRKAEEENGLGADARPYQLMPYEESTREEYLARHAALKKIDWSKFRGDGEDEKYCSGDSCIIRRDQP